VATYQISQLAERSGVPATTLRYYEQAGLLTPTRSPNGYRRYTDEALDRLALIRAAQHLGLPLADIRDLLTVRDGGQCATVRARLRPLLAARVATAQARAAELAASITRLSQARTATDPPPPPAPLVGEVVGPASDGDADGRVPQRPGYSRLTTDQPPPTRFEGPPGT